MLSVALSLRAALKHCQYQSIMCTIDARSSCCALGRLMDLLPRGFMYDVSPTPWIEGFKSPLSDDRSILLR